MYNPNHDNFITFAMIFRQTSKFGVGYALLTWPSEKELKASYEKSGMSSTLGLHLEVICHTKVLANQGIVYPKNTQNNEINDNGNFCILLPCCLTHPTIGLSTKFGPFWIQISRELHFEQAMLSRLGLSSRKSFGFFARSWRICLSREVYPLLHWINSYLSSFH